MKSVTKKKKIREDKISHDIFLYLEVGRMLFHKIMYFVMFILYKCTVAILKTIFLYFVIYLIV